MDGEKSLHAIRNLSNFLLDDEDAVSSELIQKTLALALVQSLKSNVALHKDLDELKNRLLEYEKKVDFIDRDLMDTQQYIRRWSIEIKGIPETIAQKDLQSYVVHQILERSCGYQFHDSYIEAVHRLKKRNMNEPAHVVVRLNNRRDAENTIRGRWKLRSYGHLRNIFVMDNLCPRYRDIFDDLTDLKESGLVKQVWSYNGKVHYKTTHNRRAKGKRVWHMDDLKPIKESALTLNFERQARNEYDQQLPSLMNINVAPPPNRPRPPSPPTPTPPPPLAEAAEAAEPTVATIVTNITDVSDLSVADDIPDLESSRDAESGTLAFTISPVSLPSGDNEVSEISSHVPAVSNAAVESSSAVVESDSPVNEFAESSSYQISAAVALSSHPPSSEIAETSPNEPALSMKSQDACNEDESVPSVTVDVFAESSSYPASAAMAVSSHSPSSVAETSLKELAVPTKSQDASNDVESVSSVPVEEFVESSSYPTSADPPVYEFAESSSYPTSAAGVVSSHPSPTPEAVEISFHVPAVAAVESPSAVVESDSPVNMSADTITSHDTSSNTTLPTDVAADDTNSCTHVSKEVPSPSSNAAIEAPSHQSPTLESVVISSCVPAELINSPKPTTINVIYPVDSATVHPQITGSPLKGSTPGHDPSLGTNLPTDVATSDSNANDLNSSMVRNPIISAETNSVPINEDPIIWSDEDVFIDPDEPTPAFPAISPPAPTSITEADRACDHFYSCSSSIGGLQLKLKRETASILNEFCRSLGSSSPKSPSTNIQSIASLSESQLSHAGFFNHNESVPEVNVKLSRCNSYASLLTEHDSSG